MAFWDLSGYDVIRLFCIIDLKNMGNQRPTSTPRFSSSLTKASMLRFSVHRT